MVMEARRGMRMISRLMEAIWGDMGRKLPRSRRV